MLVSRKVHCSVYRPGKPDKHGKHTRLAGPLPLLYYLRFGQIWHHSRRAREAATFSSKYANKRTHAHNNKHGNAVYEMHFGSNSARNEKLAVNGTPTDGFVYQG